MELAPDFDEFIGCLNARRVEFLVVGAYALAFHGAPRFTGDFDVWIRPTLDNGKRLIDAVRDFGFPAPELTPQAVTQPRALLEIGVEPVQIHVMSAISGVTWDEAWPRRVPGPCGRQVVAFLGRDAFLQNKRAAGRPKDLADIDALREGEP
jgi:hypothetical protein